ncbi:EpsG family protein [Leptospira sp. 3 VSF25]|uniref:EpsG family protein n=2 Tax=Leptospira limi TaxID=2950023 RepID=A0ABT3M1W4_9LEPT|nr:EpsG family protein [Leptospira limi]MCW7463958.1 EpsG family protein [Leptospira limi]
MIMKQLNPFFEYLNTKQWLTIGLFIILWGVSTLFYWKKYQWNPSSMVNFGLEFALQNDSETPENAILFKGETGDLGAGYDGQIFYYFSRPLANLNLDWPKGFDESYRAPRIGYPLLIAIFGIFGKSFAIFGMYFWNISLIIVSYFFLRKLLNEETKPYAVLYLLSPFALGSYYVLVSDSVMVSLLIIAYYFYVKEKWIQFILLSSLAILTKEPALFLLFPLGLLALLRMDWKRVIVVGSVLVIPVCWHLYLSYKFPNWRPGRLTDFILPFEGLISYSESIWRQLASGGSIKELARLLSRFPLVILFFLGVFLPFTGKIQKGWEFRISFLLVMFMVGTAGYYHFWSVYENVSRMFTLSIPILLLLMNEDRQIRKQEYILMTLLILVFFLLKVLFISKQMNFQVGF